ncbi:hypothetical protein [Pseudomonas kilonensis]|uniref:hypothetical protein n=1 Tax=Pseudomonas kilonensis TaxID=132476 RepID=UPI00339981A9
MATRPEIDGIPLLIFSGVNYGPRETHHDLRCLVYERGTRGNVRDSQELLASEHKTLVPERIQLALKIHETLNSIIVGGGSALTLRGKIGAVRGFFQWAEDRHSPITLTTVEALYLSWSDYLWERVRNRGIEENYAANLSSKLGSLLSGVLELSSGLHSRTPFFNAKVRSRNRTRIKTASDKVDLPEAFKFGRFLHDITRNLTLERIQSALPLLITFSDGQEISERSGYSPNTKSVRALAIADYADEEELIAETFRARYALINLRVMAELLIFISQTAMNLNEARKLKIGKFSYKSLSRGYEVRRIYKNRKKGVVEFEIFSEYRIIFEYYLEWRNTLYSTSTNDLLFPFFSYQCNGNSDFAPSFLPIKSRCKILGITPVLPRNLRKLKLNWFARETKNLELTLELGQHTKETYLRHYHQPNFQIALIEISSFFNTHDPTLQAAGTGGCSIANPLAIENIPKQATTPDCVSAAGCLFCVNHRDIDSQDHVWSLVSYRHYKILELATYTAKLIPHDTNPCALAIDALNSKIQYFSASEGLRPEWVAEALERIAESHYHPKWDGFIKILELTSENAAQY